MDEHAGIAALEADAKLLKEGSPTRGPGCPSGPPHEIEGGEESGGGGSPAAESLYGAWQEANASFVLLLGVARGQKTLE
jgi:hypothetical protein